jgi:hypothetical protein
VQVLAPVISVVCALFLISAGVLMFLASSDHASPGCVGSTVAGIASAATGSVISQVRASCPSATNPQPGLKRSGPRPPPRP